MEFNRIKGVTLIELVVVLVIISIIYFVASFSFKPYGFISLDVVVKKLITDLEYCKSLAINQPLDSNNNVLKPQFYFNTSSQYYEILLDSQPIVDPQNPGRQFRVYFGTGNFKDFSLATVLINSVPADSFYFNSKGLPCNSDGSLWAGDGSVIISTKKNSLNKTVIVEAGTGRIYLSE